MKNITLTVKTVTPMCQIEGNTKIQNMDYITIKQMSKIINGNIVKIPIYTANGFRGLLRRKASEILAQKAMEKGIDIKTTDFHLMFAGGGNNFQKQPLEVENRARELNPVVSLFGTSLAVEGKLSVTHLEPKNVENYVNDYGTSLVEKMVFIKKDDLLDRTKFSRFVKYEDIIEWEKHNKEEIAQRNADRSIEKEKEDKVKKTTIKHIQGRFYVIPNTEFQGYIGYKYPLTDIEYGLLLKALEAITDEQLGSTKNLGFGICEWKINTADGTSEIVSVPKRDNLYESDKNVFYDEDEEKAVEAFEKWLENISKENIEISKVLIQSK